VPSSALPGDHYISAVQRSTGTGAQFAFLVQTDWAEFHFLSNHKGVNPYENVLSPANVGNMDLQWSFPAIGFVDSSPAVAGGIVYFGSNGTDANGTLYALNTATGAVVWKYVTGNSVVSSPAVANGVVYVGSADNNLYALNA